MITIIKNLTYDDYYNKKFLMITIIKNLTYDNY
jgi:hypothetical protein